jgi:hypothetical protein
VRTFASLLFVFDEVSSEDTHFFCHLIAPCTFQIVFLPIVIYVPALAFNQGRFFYDEKLNTSLFVFHAQQFN